MQARFAPRRRAPADFPYWLIRKRCGLPQYLVHTSIGLDRQGLLFWMPP